MKTTVEIPDDLFRASKADAALHGESLKEFMAAALKAYLASRRSVAPRRRGWRSVFGQARPEEIREVEEIVAQEFGQVDPEDWR